MGGYKPGGLSQRKQNDMAEAARAKACAPAERAPAAVVEEKFVEWNFPSQSRVEAARLMVEMKSSTSSFGSREFGAEQNLIYNELKNILLNRKVVR